MRATSLMPPANPAIFKKFGGKFVVRARQIRTPGRQESLAPCRDRVSRLCDGGGLLQFAGISGQHQNPSGRTRSTDLVIIEGYDGPQP